MKPYALANFGRAGSSAPVRESMRRVAEGLPHGTVFAAIEIDEGDSGYEDRKILRETFGTTWLIHHGETREPILTKGGHVRPMSAKRFIIRGSAVPRQSPVRSIQEIVVVDQDHAVAVLDGHFAAGVHNGHRPAHIKAALSVGYWRMWARLKRRIRHHRRQGRSVVTLFDLNWRSPRRRLHRRQVVAFHDGPDWCHAIPAKGRRVRLGERGRIDLTIEPMHDCTWRRIGFPLEKE